MNCKIAICDDSAIDSKYIAALVNEWAKLSENRAIINTFPSAEAFLFHYADDKSYDILLLDIEMGNISGIALAKQIRAENETIQIVFITGFPDFIAEGYDVSALHYLMKPVIAEKFFAVLNKAVKNCRKAEHAVLFNKNGENMRVPADKIIFAEAFAHLVAIHIAGSSFEVKMSISEAEKLLGEGFIRCHRSYIVGLKYIRSISKTDITLDNSVKIPLSRNSYKTVNQAFIRYFKGDG